MLHFSYYKILVIFPMLCNLSLQLAAAAKLLQSCLTLCDPMDCSPSGSSVHGILQARILEWVAMPSCRGSSRPRDQTQISYVCCVHRQVLYHWCPLGPLSYRGKVKWLPSVSITLHGRRLVATPLSIPLGRKTLPKLRQALRGHADHTDHHTGDSEVPSPCSDFRELV